MPGPNLDQPVRSVKIVTPNYWSRPMPLAVNNAPAAPLLLGRTIYQAGIRVNRLLAKPGENGLDFQDATGRALLRKTHEGRFHLPGLQREVQFVALWVVLTRQDQRGDRK